MCCGSYKLLYNLPRKSKFSVCSQIVQSVNGQISCKHFSHVALWNIMDQGSLDYDGLPSLTFDHWASSQSLH